MGNGGFYGAMPGCWRPMRAGAAARNGNAVLGYGGGHVHCRPQPHHCCAGWQPRRLAGRRQGRNMHGKRSWLRPVFLGATCAGDVRGAAGVASSAIRPGLGGGTGIPAICAGRAMPSANAPWRARPAPPRWQHGQHLRWQQRHARPGHCGRGGAPLPWQAAARRRWQAACPASPTRGQSQKPYAPARAQRAARGWACPAGTARMRLLMPSWRRWGIASPCQALRFRVAGIQRGHQYRRKCTVWRGRGRERWRSHRRGLSPGTGRGLRHRAAG